jgi:hypothetical protein
VGLVLTRTDKAHTFAARERGRIWARTTSQNKTFRQHKLFEMNFETAKPYLHVAVTWAALVSLVLCRRAIRNNHSPISAFPLFCLLFHMCTQARQSTNTIHVGII